MSSVATSPPEVAGRGTGRTLVTNSTLAFVLAAMVNDTLHELAHAVAALSVGLVPILTPFAVDTVRPGSP